MPTKTFLKNKYKKEYKTGYKKVPKKVKEYVKKEIDRNVEDKVMVGGIYFGDHANPWVSETFQYHSINNLVRQGTGPEKRIGDSIRIKRLELSFEFMKYYDNDNKEAYGFRPDDSFRIFVIDKRIPFGNVADPTEYLVKYSANSYQSALYNDYWLKNYKILMDKKVIIHCNEYMNYLPTAGIYKSVIKQIKKTIRWKKGLLVQYTGDTGLIADIIKHYLSIMVVWTGGNDIGTLGYPPKLNIMYKLVFEDS